MDRFGAPIPKGFNKKLVDYVPSPQRAAWPNVNLGHRLHQSEGAPVIWIATGSHAVSETA
jgi:hypothetical protein